MNLWICFFANIRINACSFNVVTTPMHKYTVRENYNVSICPVLFAVSIAIQKQRKCSLKNPFFTRTKYLCACMLIMKMRLCMQSNLKYCSNTITL